jgi:hypothetical protein
MLDRTVRNARPCPDVLLVPDEAGRDNARRAAKPQASWPSKDQAAPSRRLFPIMTIVVIAFLVIGAALPVLPLYVHHDLGLSAVMVGAFTGSQFLASLLSRIWAGRYSDRRGSKRAVVFGLALAIAGGALYLLSVDRSCHKPRWYRRPGRDNHRRSFARRFASGSDRVARPQCCAGRILSSRAGDYTIGRSYA